MRHNDNPVVVGQMATGDLGHFYVGVDTHNQVTLDVATLATLFGHHPLGTTTQ